jgi:serine-type D-Ala-D-Ala carboxypeptidase/endopeptidase
MNTAIAHALQRLLTAVPSIWMKALFLLVAWPHCVGGADGGTDSVDSLVESAATAFMENGRTVGLSIGIHVGGKDRMYNFGTTERGKQVPPTATTQYCIGSITKTFTGTLLAQAVMEKKLSLDDDVRGYLPEQYPNLEFADQPIRLWQLANHTSGLPLSLPEKTTPLTGGVDEKNDLQLFAQEAAFLRTYKAADFLRDLHDVKLTRPPGVSFSYSNAAAQLLGLVLERVYGQTYEDLVRAKICDRLGMEDTQVTLSTAQVERLPKAYTANAAFAPPVSDWLPAHGSLKSTTADMLKYAVWHLAETDQAVQLTHQPAGTTVWTNDNSYAVALNWQIIQPAGDRKVFQGGSVPGHQSLCVLYPKSNRAIVALTNEVVGKDPVDLSTLVDRILQEIGGPNS